MEQHKRSPAALALAPGLGLGLGLVLVLVLVLVLALALAPAAGADDAALLRAKARYLPPAQRSFAGDSDGLQARYDAGRDLVEAVRAADPPGARCVRLRNQLYAFGLAQVRIAESADRPVPTAAPRLPRVTASCHPTAATSSTFRFGRVTLGLPRGSRVAVPPRETDAALAARLARLGSSFRGWAGIWTHDLASGRTAGWNADARFPAASTVKLGVVAATLRRYAHPERSPAWYDLQRIGAWSSNLAANRLSAQVGYGAVAAGLRSLGMWSSTYPGPYRAATAVAADVPRPPPHGHTRVTTARDLGRALYRLHAAAIGNRRAQRDTGLTPLEAKLGVSLLLASEPLGDNRGLLRPWLGRIVLAEKNGWLSDTRVTAALVYPRGRPTIVVVEAYRPSLDPAAARRLGRDVLRALRLAK